MATAAAAGLDDEAVRLALVTAQHGADLVAIADEVGVEDPVARELGMHGSAVMSAYQDVTSPEMLYADDVLIQAAQNVSAGTPALLALLPRDALAGCGL